MSKQSLYVHAVQFDGTNGEECGLTQGPPLTGKGYEGLTWYFIEYGSCDDKYKIHPRPTDWIVEFLSQTYCVPDYLFKEMQKDDT